MEQNENQFPKDSQEVNQNNVSDNTNGQSIEEQEQINSENLVQRIEEENENNTDYLDSNETTDQPSQGEEDLSGFLERTIPDSGNSNSTENDRPLTRNLLGDNPPGAEQAVFNSGNIGDASADEFKYESENLVEGFRENIDKTEQQLNLDKRLKDQLDEEE